MSVKLDFSLLDKVQPVEQAKIKEKRKVIPVKLDFSILDSIDIKISPIMEDISADKLAEFLEKCS